MPFILFMCLRCSVFIKSAIDHLDFPKESLIFHFSDLFKILWIINTIFWKFIHYQMLNRLLYLSNKFWICQIHFLYFLFYFFRFSSLRLLFYERIIFHFFQIFFFNLLYLITEFFFHPLKICFIYCFVLLITSPFFAIILFSTFFLKRLLHWFCQEIKKLIGDPTIERIGKSHWNFIMYTAFWIGGVITDLMNIPGTIKLCKYLGA